jgi:hypothetical protein
MTTLPLDCDTVSAGFHTLRSDPTDAVTRRLNFSSTVHGLEFLYQSFKTPPDHRVTVGSETDQAVLFLRIKHGRQSAAWYCHRKGCHGSGCPHFTGEAVLDQSRKMVRALAAYGGELPWHDMRQAGDRPVPAEEHERLLRELPEVTSLPEHVLQILGDALVGLLDQIEQARANDTVQAARAKDRALVKKLFEELPAGTLLMRDDGLEIGTMTDARGRTTKRSIDITGHGSKAVIRQDVRLEIRDRFRLVSVERLQTVPTAVISSHKRLELLSRVRPLGPRFAAIA